MSETPSPVASATARGGSQSDLRRYNERVVLGVIRSSPGTFNAELSRSTGLAAQTISVILRSLEDQDLILRGPVLRGRRGQPATPISINPDGACAIGAEIGWKHLSVVAISLSGAVLAEKVCAYDAPDPSTIARELQQAILAMYEGLPDAARSRVSGVGVAMPATLQEGWVPAGIGVDPALHIDALAVARDYEELTGCAVISVGDGAAACRAETIGQHRGWSNFAYLFIGTLISAGFVLSGRVFEGPRGNAANLGSVIVPGSTGGPVTADGCASLAALDQRLRAAGHADLFRVTGDWAWREAEAVVEAWLDDAVPVLAYVISNTAATIEFERLVIDSALPRDLFDELMTRIRVRLADHVAAGFRLPEIVAGEIGITAAAIGAASLPLHREFFALETS